MHAVSHTPLLLSLFAFGLGGCARDTALPSDSPPALDAGQGEPDADTCSIKLSVRATIKDKIDLLFMIDNSNSMSAMQTELKQKFPDFFRPFQNLADIGKKADLNIGVVTSDYGAGATGAPGCSTSPGGDGGRLQPIGKKAAGNCKKPIGSDFVHYVFSPDPADATNNNLPPGQNLVDTFNCMASVGDTGCGFEHQLESVYAALHNNLPSNQGFLRDDAILAVVFLTNEDDGSAPPESNVFDKNRTAQYGFEDSYSRQTRFAIQCCAPGLTSCGSDLQFPPYADSGGPLANCTSARNYPPGAGPGKQYDISRYIDFFTKPAQSGGVKASPLDVVLIGIDAPSKPFQVILSNPGTFAGQPFIPCPQLNEQSNPACVPVLQHSCVNQNHPEFFGDPAVRLNAVINAAPKHEISSICDDSYAPALGAAAKGIVSVLGGCIPHKLPPDPTDSTKLKLDCTVTGTTQNGDGTFSNRTVSQCPNNGPNPGLDPCWRIEPKESCQGISPDGVGVTIDPAGSVLPAHTTFETACRC